MLDRSGEVVPEAGTDTGNHVWVDGLSPDTGYGYRIRVDGLP